LKTARSNTGNLTAQVEPVIKKRGLKGMIFYIAISFNPLLIFLRKIICKKISDTKIINNPIDAGTAVLVLTAMYRRNGNVI